MDPVLAAAARALAVFDPLGALKPIALRNDPEALALRGVAMAQLGDYAVARRLLGRAARVFETSDPRARARCLAAQAEIALAARDLVVARSTLDAAIAELEAHGDRSNALFARLQRLRCLVLVGALTEAREEHRALVLRGAPPRLRAFADLVSADLSVRCLEPRVARKSLARARAHAKVAAIPSLVDEIEVAIRELDSPVARVVRDGTAHDAALDEVVAVLATKDLVVDACRRSVRSGNAVTSLVKRPVLLALAVALAHSASGEVPRDALAQEAFGARPSASIRVRLRVEIGRLRRALLAVAKLEATSAGYALRPRRGASVVLLLPPAPGEASAILALLRDGEPWSTSALATAIGGSQRTVQRALVVLRDAGKVEVTGRGRTQRWVARPPEGFATSLLLLTRPSSV